MTRGEAVGKSTAMVATITGIGASIAEGGFKTVEFEFRVRVRVSSNFLPLTSTKTVELPN